jgi:predicted dehydrogenase/aryl-alcohol dehydrogenase-like predicted oxidoreductase
MTAGGLLVSDRSLAWGIIGPGNIAHRFASQLPQSRTGHLVAVGSRQLARAQEFAAKYEAPHSYGSYEELLADDGVDAVYIATPHPGHAEWAVKAAEAGKHILVEKPMSLNHAWSMAMVEAARAHDVFLMEAFMYRCHPQAKRLAELIRSGAVGTVLQIEASFAFAAGFNPTGRLFDPNLAGGGILDVGGYPVSVARLIAGAASGQPFANPVEVSAVGQLGESGIDEWTTATLRFADGISAHVTTGVRLAAENVVRVIGSQGYLVVPQPWLPSPTEPSTLLLHRVGAEVEEITIEANYQYASEADAVADHLAERQAPEMSWDDSLGNIAVLDKWRDAIGLQYPAERGDANIPTITGAPLRRRDSHTMRYGHVAGVDKQISRLVLGVDNQPNLPHATMMFDDFIERGGNAFDTAHIYGGGRHEPLLGQWVSNRGIRDDIVIIGKGAHTPHCDPESITKQLMISLERLQTDYLDIYFMHRDNEEIPVGEFVDVLDEHYQAGRIRIFGGSNWSLERFAEANEYAKRTGKQGFSVLSNHISLAQAYDVPWAGCRHVSDPESRKWLTETQVPLFPWSSQARGFFARANPEDKSDAELVRCYYSDENFERLRRARQLGDELGVPPTAIALAYVLHLPFPTFPLFGPRTLAETRTSIAALDITLTPEQVAWLDLSA